MCSLSLPPLCVFAPQIRILSRMPEPPRMRGCRDCQRYWTENSVWRKPLERPHRKVVGAAVVDSERICKVVKRVKAVTGVEAFLVFSVAALHLTVMSWSIRADEFVLDSQLSSGILKQGWDVPFAVRNRLVNSKPLSVWTHSTRSTPACVPLHQTLEEVRGRNRWTARDRRPESGAWKTRQ